VLEIVENQKTVLIETSQNDKALIPRGMLAKYSPCLRSKLDDKQINILTGWLASRYNRTALPDNFESRIEKKAEDRIKKALSKALPITALLINLSSWQELDEKTNYVVTIKAIFKSEADNSSVRKDMDTRLNEVCNALESCKGITVNKADTEVIPDNEARIILLRSFKKWHYDSISLKDQDTHAAPLKT